MMSESVSQETPRSTALAQVQTGVCRCAQIDGPPESQVRLKRLGICEGRDVTILQNGDPMILGVAGTQVAVSRLLAECVYVDPRTESMAHE